MGLSSELSYEAGSFSCHFNPHRIFQSEVLRLYFPTLEPWLRGLSRSPVFPPSLSAHTCRITRSASHRLAPSSSQPPLCCDSSLPICSSPPLLPVWMNVSSLTPWLSDFHTVQFSGNSGCFLFLNLLSFFWLYKEAKCIYLRLHLGWKSTIHIY